MSDKITYRKGYPSKKSILFLIEQFRKNNQNFIVHKLDAYGYTHTIVWSNFQTQEKVEDFISFLNEYNIEVGLYRPKIDNATNGSLQILKKIL